MEYVEYPKWVYQAKNGEVSGVIVLDEASELALDGRWFATPAEALLGKQIEQQVLVQPDEPVSEMDLSDEG